ncbi:MAG TPA: TIGR02281 family clan AA aspartic protease [Stellaceae bacterium]|nr:TIGR02281 family clan AA aspartic protease [Stellaceae bacterium]
MTGAGGSGASGLGAEGGPMLGWTLRVTAVLIALTAAAAWTFSPGGLASLLPHRQSQRADARAPAAGRAVPNELVYRRSRDGHFYVEADVNGALIRFVVDTGASMVALSPDDARAAGLQVIAQDFTLRANTANGIARVAPVTLRALGLGQFTANEVPAIVVEQPMQISLLGMSFLARLQGFETRGDELVLRW